MSIASTLQSCHFSTRGKAANVRSCASSYSADPELVLRAMVGRATLAEVEKVIILSRLSYLNGHRARTAQSLGIGLRTLGIKLKAWGVR